MYVAQGGTADNVALDVRLPGYGVAVPLFTLSPFFFSFLVVSLMVVVLHPDLQVLQTFMI